MAADGRLRYARGTRRRSVLVEAAAGLLLEQGLPALSHRAVAARAGLPLASTTYYFGSADDLRDEALQHVAEVWLTRAGAVLEALPARLDRRQAAQAVVGVLGLDTPVPQLLPMYERYLQAGRHERLRPLVVAYDGRLLDLVREVLRRAALPADDADLVLAVADGAALTALAEGRAPVLAVHRALERVVALLQPT